MHKEALLAFVVRVATPSALLRVHHNGLTGTKLSRRLSGKAATAHIL